MKTCSKIVTTGNQIFAVYPNGTYTEYTYNPQRNWLVSMVNKDSTATVLSSFDYTYDNVGNRIQMTENRGQLTETTINYVYNNIYELTSETRTGSNAYSINYSYDGVGNRLTMFKDGQTITYTYNANNQLTSLYSALSTLYYSYDLNGNLVSKNDGTDTTLYEWDWENRLISTTDDGRLTQYAYDGDGNRISKTTDGVKTKYINDVGLPLVQVLIETTDEDTVLATYTYGNDLVSAINHTLSTINYFHYDGLGSTRQLTDSSGAVVAEYTYEAFGTLIASSGASENNYLFTGEQFDSSSRLLFLRARYYDSNIGRFISRDPIGSPIIRSHGNFWLVSTLIFKPSRLYPYTYCANNSVNSRDPGGLLDLGIGQGSCDPLNIAAIESRCTKACCDQHDDCYAEHGCSWTSWLPHFVDTRCPTHNDDIACSHCNRDAFGCLLGCLISPDLWFPWPHNPFKK